MSHTRHHRQPRKGVSTSQPASPPGGGRTTNPKTLRKDFSRQVSSSSAVSLILLMSRFPANSHTRSGWRRLKFTSCRAIRKSPAGRQRQCITFCCVCLCGRTTFYASGLGAHPHSPSFRTTWRALRMLYAASTDPASLF